MDISTERGAGRPHPRPAAGLLSVRLSRSWRRVQDGSGPIAAAAVRANSLTGREFHTHELAAARTVLHRAKADLNVVTHFECILRPAEPNQLRDRTAFEG